jgi:hypothetical protein
MDIAVAGAGVAVTLDNGVFRSARIALSSVAPTPLYVRAAGEWLAGKPANDDSIRHAAEIAKDETHTEMRFDPHREKDVPYPSARKSEAGGPGRFMLSPSTELNSPILASL